MSAQTRTNRAGVWLLSLVCCGNRDGYQVCESWEAADEFRGYYTDPGDAPSFYAHDRSAVLTKLSVPTRCGYHDHDPAEFDRIVASPREQTR